MLSKVRAWGAKILRQTFRARMLPGESLGGLQDKDRQVVAHQVEKMGLPLLTEKIVDKIWMTTNWATYDGNVPILKALRSILVWKTTTWWRSRSAWGWRRTPTNVTRRKFGFSRHRKIVGHTDVEVGRRREGLDTAHGAGSSPQGRRDVTRVNETSNGNVPTKNLETWPRLYLKCPRRTRN